MIKKIKNIIYNFCRFINQNNPDNELGKLSKYGRIKNNNESKSK